MEEDAESGVRNVLASSGAEIRPQESFWTRTSHVNPMRTLRRRGGGDFTFSPSCLFLCPFP